MKEGSEISYCRSIRSFSLAGFTLRLGDMNFFIIAGFCYTAINSLEKKQKCLLKRLKIFRLEMGKDFPVEEKHW